MSNPQSQSQSQTQIQQHELDEITQLAKQLADKLKPHQRALTLPASVQALLLALKPVLAVLIPLILQQLGLGGLVTLTHTDRTV
jgi:hypothetical protein